MTRGAGRYNPIILGLVLAAVFLSGCTPSADDPVVARPDMQVQTTDAVFGNGSLLELKRSGESSAQRVLNGQVRGAIIHPVTHFPLVFMQDEEIWVIMSVEEASDRVIYTSRVPLDACGLSPNGHLLWCLQADELVMVDMQSGKIQRVDTGVVGASWSTNNQDLLVVYTDRIDVVSVHITQQVSSHTPVSAQAVTDPIFVDASHVLWTEHADDGDHLILFDLRSKNGQEIWSGQLISRPLLQADLQQIVVADQTGTQIIDATDGSVEETLPGVTLVGWVGSDVLRIDQVSGPLYHFSTSTTDWGEAEWAATPGQLTTYFQD